MTTFGGWLEAQGVAIPGEPGQLARYWRDSKGKRPRASGVETISRWILADTDRIDPNMTTDGAEAAMVALTEAYHVSRQGGIPPDETQEEYQAKVDARLAELRGMPGPTGQAVALPRAIADLPPGPDRDAGIAAFRAVYPLPGTGGSPQQPDQAADGVQASLDEALAAADDPPYQDRAYSLTTPAPVPPAPAGQGAPAEALALLRQQDRQRRELGHVGAYQQPGPPADGGSPAGVREIAEAMGGVVDILRVLDQRQMADEVQLARIEASLQHVRGMLGTLDAKLAQILDWQADVDWQAAQEPGEALEAALAEADIAREAMDEAGLDLAAGIGQQIREDQARGDAPWQQIMRGEVPGWRLECPNPACAELDGRHKPGCDAVSIPRQIQNVGRPMHSHTPAELCTPACPSYGPPPQPAGQPLSFYGRPPVTATTQEPDGPYGISEVPGG